LLSVAAHFNWAMAPRFGADQGSLGPDGISAPSNVPDGRIDIHNDPFYVQNIDPVTRQRVGYKVNFDASPSTWTDSPILSYSWLVLGVAADGRPGAAPSPEIVLPGGATTAETTQTGGSQQMNLNLLEGTYSVSLTVTTATGQTNTEQQLVPVRDILIVSAGDSAASGEGDPDVPASANNGVPLWADSPNARQADRSGQSAAAKAALQLEVADLHTSVTFVSVAVSGDPTIQGLINSGGSWATSLQGPDTDRGQHESQIDMIRDIVGNRPIDALLVTTGADDIGFTDIVTKLVLAPDPVPAGGLASDILGAISQGSVGDVVGTLIATGSSPTDVIGAVVGTWDHIHPFATVSGLQADVLRPAGTSAPDADWTHASINDLPDIYHKLDLAIQARLPNVQNVYLTEYFDPTHDSHGNFVDGGLGDVVPGLQVNAAEESWAFTNVVGSASTGKGMNGAIATAVAVANQNHAQDPAHHYATWHLVSGIADAFLDHGYTASDADRWVNTIDESLAVEGPTGTHLSSSNSPVPSFLQPLIDVLNHLPFTGSALDRLSDLLHTQGTSHPNDKGQAAIAGFLVSAVQPLLQSSASTPYALTIDAARHSLAIAPHQADTAPHTIVVRRAQPDPRSYLQVVDPNAFQVVIDGTLVCEAPVSFIRQLTISGFDGNCTFVVFTSPAGMTITLDGGAGTDTFDVEATGSPVTVVAGTGPTTVNLCADYYDLGNFMHNLASIQANVTVQGNGATALNLFDQAGSATGAYVLNTSSISVPVGSTVNFSGVSDLTLRAEPVANTITVEHTGAGHTTVIAGTGTSQISLSPTGKSLFGVSNLSVNGASRAALVMNDQNGDASVFAGVPSSAYTLDGATLTHRLSGVIRPSPLPFPGRGIGNLKPQFWLTTATVSYQYVGSLTLDTGNHSNADSVLGTSAPTTIQAGSAGDTITVGPALNAITGPLTLDAGGGAVILDERSHPPPGTVVGVDGLRQHTIGYTVTDQSVTRSEHGYQFVSNPSPSPWGSGTPVPLGGGPGPGGLPGSVPPDGQQLPPPQGPTLAVGVVDVSNTETINYRHASSLEIDAGTVSTGFAVNATAAGTPVTVQGGQGGSAVTVGDSSVKRIRSQVTVSGPGSLVVDDSAAASQDRVTVTPTQVGAAAADQFFGSGGSLTYGGPSALTLNLSNANDDTVRLTPSATTAMTVNGSQAAFQAGRGAVLTLDTTGASGAANQGTAAGAGRWTFGNRQAVTYSNLAVPLVDVSGRVAVSATALTAGAAANTYAQTVTIRNTGGSAIVGPLSLVLDGLGSGVTLNGGTGVTQSRAPAGSPYVNVALPGNVLAANQSVTVVLSFRAPSRSAIAYHSRVLAGTGAR
jgi:hypothetical protein